MHWQRHSQLSRANPTRTVQGSQWQNPGRSAFATARRLAALKGTPFNRLKAGRLARTGLRFRARCMSDTIDATELSLSEEYDALVDVNDVDDDALAHQQPKIDIATTVLGYRCLVHSSYACARALCRAATLTAG